MAARAAETNQRPISLKPIVDVGGSKLNMSFNACPRITRSRGKSQHLPAFSCRSAEVSVNWCASEAHWLATLSQGQPRPKCCLRLCGCFTVDAGHVSEFMVSTSIMVDVCLHYDGLATWFSQLQRPQCLFPFGNLGNKTRCDAAATCFGGAF